MALVSTQPYHLTYGILMNKMPEEMPAKLSPYTGNKPMCVLRLTLLVQAHYLVCLIIPRLEAQYLACKYLAWRLA